MSHLHFTTDPNRHSAHHKIHVPTHYSAYQCVPSSNPIRSFFLGTRHPPCTDNRRGRPVGPPGCYVNRPPHRSNSHV